MGAFCPPPTPPQHQRPCGEPPAELVPSWGAKPCWGGRVIWVSACPHSAGERSLPCSWLLPQPQCLSASSPGGVLGGGLSLLALPLAPGWGLLGGRDGAGGCWQCPVGLAPPPLTGLSLGFGASARFPGHRCRHHPAPPHRGRREAPILSPDGVTPAFSTWARGSGTGGRRGVGTPPPEASPAPRCCLRALRRLPKARSRRAERPPAPSLPRGRSLLFPWVSRCWGGEAGGFAAVCGAWTERPGRQGRAS